MDRPPLIGRIAAPRQRSGICLNMIVKDEAPVIGRALDSVREVIECYRIVDTGSTDGTPEAILAIMDTHGVPGEVHFRPWVDFGHNRQQALDLVYADASTAWALFIDADEELGYRDPAFYRDLQAGTSYDLEKRYGNLAYRVPHLINIANARWSWHGPVHEYLAVEGNPPRRFLAGVWIQVHPGEGSRSRGLSPRQKFLRDAELLETALQRDPQNARNRFYLAQSYRDAGMPEKAYLNYHLRSLMPGWVEESYLAQLEKARLMIALKMPHGEILAAFLQAHEMRPGRAEALWHLASYCRLRQNHAQAYLFARAGAAIPLPEDRLFVRQDVYRWRLLDEWAISAYWTGRYRESAEVSRRLLAEGHHDPRDTPRLQANLRFALAKLTPGGA